jgi:hypothetical protein
MSEKFLKARIPAALYNELQVQAAEQGKRLGTHIRDVLEQHSEAMSVAAALARIEAAIGDQVAAPKAVPADHGMRPLLNEIRLLVRELAMQSNAQIVARVVAQLAAQGQTEVLQ